MVPLPSIPDLIQRTKALAALDLILSPEWDSRYYSFNSQWSSSMQMASMRNGSGDEWWMVFHDSGWAALKGLAHESDAWSKGQESLSTALQSAFPPELAAFANEPAFRWGETSFGYYQLPGTANWRHANAATPFAALDSGETEFLELLHGTPADYASFASDYYEVDVPVEIVASIFSLQPITQSTVSRLNPEVTLQQIQEELFNEIAYPR